MRICRAVREEVSELGIWPEPRVGVYSGFGPSLDRIGTFNSEELGWRSDDMYCIWFHSELNS